MLPRSDLSPDELRLHMAGTYFTLRSGMGVLAIGLPLLLAVAGPLADGEPLRCSLSAYYFSVRMRDVFVGLLVAIGAFLFLYKGFSREENWALNLAGALAIGIALVPTTGRCDGSGETWSVHTAFAFAFFVVIAGVCILLASDTLRLINDPARVRLFQRLYRLYGALMIVLPIAIAVVSRALDRGDAAFPVIFLVETAAVLTFAAYWLTKSIELRQTHAEQHALAGLVKTAEPPVDAGGAPPGRLVQVGVLSE